MNALITFMPLEKKESVLKRGQSAVELSAAISAILAVVKGIAGFLTGSLVLLSSALDSFVDFLGQVASWVGFRISRREPDERFPYGYYKAESLVTLLISFFILYAAVRLFLEGFSGLGVPSDLGQPYLAVGVAIVNVVASLYLSRYLGRVGKETSSPLLLTCSKERMMDVVSGSAVFIAVLTSFYSLPYVEGVVVMALSFLILKVGLESIRDSTFVLMDVSPSREIETEIRKIIGEFGGVESFNDLKLRKSGPFIFGEVKVRVKKHQKVFAAHELAEAIEAKIKERIPEVDSLIIHLEPCQMGECRIAIPLKTSKGMNSALAEGLSGAPYLMFADVNKDEKLVRGFKVEKNPAKSTSVRRGLKAAEFISSNKVDFVLVRKISPVPFHTLSDKMVEIYTLDGKTAREAIDNFLEDRLDHLPEPNKPKP